MHERHRRLCKPVSASDSFALGTPLRAVPPPSSGKTLLARFMPSILPRMTPTEALDVTRIYSVADMLPGDVPLIRHRPLRAPHHTVSHAGARNTLGTRRELSQPVR
jgi:predicted ATPase with chaperone activity